MSEEPTTKKCPFRKDLDNDFLPCLGEECMMYFSYQQFVPNEVTRRIEEPFYSDSKVITSAICRLGNPMSYAPHVTSNPNYNSYKEKKYE